MQSTIAAKSISNPTCDRMKTKSIQTRLEQSCLLLLHIPEQDFLELGGINSNPNEVRIDSVPKRYISSIIFPGKPDNADEFFKTAENISIYFAPLRMMEFFLNIPYEKGSAGLFVTQKTTN